MSEGVAEASEDDGDGVIVVGIGVGGSVKIGVGDGEEVASTDGAGEVGSTLGGTRRGSGKRSLGGGDHSTRVSGRVVAGWVVAGWVGAVPSVPIPLVATTWRWGVEGAPKAQPSVMANGSPRTRRYKNSNFGVSRTHEHRSWSGKVTVSPPDPLH